MLRAWSLTKNDTILNVLPLHHVHGMINCVMSPLYAGGTVVMMNKFDAEQVRVTFIICFDRREFLRHGIIYSTIVIQPSMSFPQCQLFISS